MVDCVASHYSSLPNAYKQKMTSCILFLFLVFPYLAEPLWTEFVSVDIFTVPLLVNRISGLGGTLMLYPCYKVLCQMAVEFLFENTFNRELTNS